MESSAGLLKNTSFMRLWGAQILSNAGSQITSIALPLTAVVMLNATPAQMGILNIAGSIPNLLFGLFAGVWVDRTRRSPILVGSDVGRAILLGSIPLAAMIGYLTFSQIVFVRFASATLGVFFTIASVSILPALVKRDQLVEANSKLAVTDSVIGVAGPGVAGGLIQLISAPKAIIVDAISYILSALSLKGISKTETSPQKSNKPQELWSEVKEGVVELVRTPLLKALTLTSSIGTFGGALQQTVLMLYLVRTLEFTPVAIGIIFAFGSGGSLLGSAIAGQTARLLGIGRAIILGCFLWALGTFLIPAASFLQELAYVVVCTGQVFIGLGASIFSVNQISLRQHLTPIDLFGRATAARRFLIFGMATAGAALAGILGGLFDLNMVLMLGALGFGLGAVVMLLSPVREVRDLGSVQTG